MTGGNKIKIAVVFAACFLFRLFPFRVPNVEPILASQMPLSKKSGAFVGFLFGFLSIALFDIAVGRVGVWTLVTAFAYGVLGVASAFYFKHFSGVRHYVLFAIAGTLFYDAITGLTIGPIFLKQPFISAVLGQIPFTLYHLLGNVVFALTLSPALEHFFFAEKKETIPICIARYSGSPLSRG